MTTTGKSSRDMTLLRLNFSSIPPIFSPPSSALIHNWSTLASTINGENAMINHKYPTLITSTTQRIASGIRYANHTMVLINVSITTDHVDFGTPIWIVASPRSEEYSE